MAGNTVDRASSEEMLVVGSSKVGKGHLGVGDKDGLGIVKILKADRKR